MTKSLHTFARVAATSHSQPLANAIRNWAGGYVFAGEQTLTRDNAQAVPRAIAADGERAVRRTADFPPPD